MTPSPACEALIKSFEKCRLKAFLPTPNDRWTCGWGATAGVTQDTVWTQDEADARFTADLAAFSAGVVRELGTAPTTQGQFDALVSFAYNEGLHAEQTSTLLRLHLAGDYAGAQSHFAEWNKQAGVVLGGLVRRRAAEAALYGVAQ